MNKTFRRALAAAFAMLLSAAPVFAMTIGTFNIEFFTMSGSSEDRSQPYTPADMRELADSIRRSGADVLALQEIEGNATMRFFVATALPGWKYFGNDTDSTQDLFFLWNPTKVTLVGTPQLYYANRTGRFEGRSFKLFDRPPLVARFKDNTSGNIYTLANVHLKSMTTIGRRDAEAARRYNLAKRAAQTEKLNELAARMEGALFILGDYNSPDPQKEVSFPLLGLRHGYSFDNWNNNLDYIGYVGIGRDKLGEVKETETRIRHRSTRRKDHPDHDIIAVEIRD